MKKLFKRILISIVALYLIFIIVSAVLLFAVHEPKVKEPQIVSSTSLDRVALVESGEDGARIRLSLIEHAQSNIDISYYIFIDGEFTDSLLGAILAAADRGVEVRILLDGLPQIVHLKGNLKEGLRGFEAHPKIALKVYEPFNPLLPWAWHNRLHEKTMVIDGALALIGGRNIGDKYYLEEVGTARHVKDRDVLILKDNPQSILDGIQHYFEELWYHPYSKTSSKTLTARQIKKRKRYNENLRQRYPSTERSGIDVDWYEHTIPTESIHFVRNPIGRVNQDPWCLQVLLDLAAQAEESIFVQSPYVIPSREMKAEFNRYDIDLEKVDMLTNSLFSSPNPIAKSAYTNHRKKIVDNGINVYEYQGPDSIHSKTYIFDDVISVVGTFNLDARSSYLDTESMVVIVSKEFTNELKNEVQTDLDNSLLVARDYTYLLDDQVREGEVSRVERVGVGVLSKIVLFFEYLL